MPTETTHPVFSLHAAGRGMQLVLEQFARRFPEADVKVVDCSETEVFANGLTSTYWTGCVMFDVHDTWLTQAERAAMMEFAATEFKECHSRDAVQCEVCDQSTKPYLEVRMRVGRNRYQLLCRLTFGWA